MDITFLCSDTNHPVHPWIDDWVARHGDAHRVRVLRHARDLAAGDLLFLISCAEIVREHQRSAFRHSLVVHASDLPRGRGWSPHVWDILNGATQLTLSLLEAADPVDSGRVWRQVRFDVPRHALWDEINRLLFAATFELVDYAVAHADDVKPQPQDATITPTYHRRRTPADSALDVGKSIAEQFDLLRICDPDRFPAYFDHLGHRYKLILEKIDAR